MDRSVFTPGFLAKEKSYITSDLHSLIGVENRPGFFSLDNIGINGENLTIAVLSMNRSALTIRLLKSIYQFLPDFGGKVLIGDNGSTQTELQILKSAAAKMPLDCQIIEFGQNYGVAGGRNRLFAAVETDWLLSLDNDLYFTSNPLPQAQKDINSLGVHFLGMPLIDKGSANHGIYGGHLYLEPMEGRAAIGVGSAYTFTAAPRDIPLEGFLCTGIPGGAAIMNTHTFFAVGGFDEDMFVGFEDTEFSVRAFQKGYKAGTCGMISLEHDHPKAEKSDDKLYEKKRFSNVKLYESAVHFEKKHGFLVWDKATAKWVAMRQQETNGGCEPLSDLPKPKIALVIDRPDWALDHIADQLICKLSDEFDFVRLYGVDIDNFTDILILSEDCQIIHVLWRGHLSTFNEDYCQQRIKNLGLTRDEFVNRYIRGKVISTEVYDHLLLEGPEKEKTPKLFIDPDSIVTNYAVSSQRLWNLYQSLPQLRLRPQAILPDGVDLQRFKPANLERFQNIKSRVIRFGWVGNSKWVVDDLKGIHTIIRPAIEQLQQEGYLIELYSSDRQEQLIPHQKMPMYYAQIDCYLCASLHEGTPNPVLEAMACGVPVISTDVGLIPELFGPLQKEFILEERSVQCLVQKIKKLLADSAQFARLSQENLQFIKKWDWRIMAENFRTYFKACLDEQKKSQSAALDK